MTNRERLAKMNDEELAKALCDMTENCEECIGIDLCKYGDGHGNGWLKWLKDEAEEDNDRQINPYNPDCSCLSAVTAGSD